MTERVRTTERPGPPTGARPRRSTAPASLCSGLGSGDPKGGGAHSCAGREAAPVGRGTRRGRRGGRARREAGGSHITRGIERRRGRSGLTRRSGRATAPAVLSALRASRFGEARMARDKATKRGPAGRGKPESPGARGETLGLGAYFLSLTLQNVRCFGKEQTLRLADAEGRPARWTVLLGENGTGKTTVLQTLVTAARPLPLQEERQERRVDPLDVGLRGPQSLAGDPPPEGDTIRGPRRAAYREGAPLRVVRPASSRRPPMASSR
jgi:AAA domain